MRGPCAQYRRNLSVGALISLMAYSATALAQTFGWTQLNDLPKPFFGGATFVVLAMAAAGTFAGLAIAPPIKGRRNLLVFIPSTTILSSWTLVVARDMGYLKVSDLVLPPMAGLLAAIAVVLLPLLFQPDVAGAFVKALKEAFGRFFNRPPADKP